MTDDERPWQRIERLAAERAARSDSELLDELRACPPLPDESDPAWAGPDSWPHAHLLVALADVCALRRLRDAVPLLLDRMCLGDPGATMRGIRHQLAGIARPDWAWLADRCADALTSRRAGTRFWALDQLAALRSPAHLAAITQALDDSEHDVVEQAASALVSVAREHPSIAPDVRRSIEAAIARLPDARALAGVLVDLDRPVATTPLVKTPAKNKVAQKTAARPATSKPARQKTAAKPAKRSAKKQTATTKKLAKASPRR